MSAAVHSQWPWERALLNKPFLNAPGALSMQVVSPTISSPVCQEQLIEAGKLVDRSVENCVRACQAATDDSELLKQVSAAASIVSQALNDLLQHVRQFASRGEPIGRYDQATDTIMCVTESIFSSMGDAGKFLRGALACHNSNVRFSSQGNNNPSLTCALMMGSDPAHNINQQHAQCCVLDRVNVL